MEESKDAFTTSYMKVERHETDYAHMLEEDTSGGLAHSVALQIIVGVSFGVICLIAVLTCIICLKRRQIKKAAPYADLFTTIKVKNPFSVVTTTSQLNEDSSTSDTYSTFELVSEHPQLETLSNTSSDSAQENVFDSISELDCHESSPWNQMTANASLSADDKSMGRSKSCAALLTLDRSSSGMLAEERTSSETVVLFTMKYTEETKKLDIIIHGVMGLPLKAYINDVQLTLHLLPTYQDAFQTKPVKADRDVRIEEKFSFDDVPPEDRDKLILRLSLQYRKSGRGTKAKSGGDSFLNLCDIEWVSGKAMPFDVRLNKARLSKDSTSEKYLLRDLGSLFVLLEYQPLAKRIKVLLRKANHLPKSDRLIGQPVHYVIINLMKDEEIVGVKETKAQSGYNPIWNQPFLFDVPGSDINQYSLDILVMRGRRYTKDGTVGHVLIGTNGPKSACSHWQEMLLPRATETARWHNLTPVLNFKSRKVPRSKRQRQSE